MALEFFKHLFRLRKNELVTDQLIADLETKFGYQFTDKNIILQALKHRSFLEVTGEDRICSNERLELLGDSVLGLVVTEHLYHKYPDKEEGELTNIKSLFVSRKILARIADHMNLGSFLLMNDAERNSGGAYRPSIIADAFEALIGAIYIDGGLEQSVRFIRKNVLASLDEILHEEQNQNYKSMLLEYSQSKNYGLPVYLVKNESGPDHNKIFTIEVRVNNNTFGIGVGNSKKMAEQIAAQNAMEKLNPEFANVESKGK